MLKYALSILLSFSIFIVDAQISQYQFSVQTKPYVSLEGGTNLTANFTEEDWEDYSYTFALPLPINFEFDQEVFCSIFEISFDGLMYTYGTDNSLNAQYEVIFAPHSDIMDYRYSGGVDSLDTEIWYKYEEGTSWIEFRNLSFFYDEFKEISPDARFDLTYIIDHETGSFQYHYGPSTYNTAINAFLEDAGYFLGFAFFIDTDVVEEKFAAILLSGNPENPVVTILENEEEPNEILTMNAMPSEGTLYSFTLNPNTTNHFYTQLTEYSVAPNPGNNEAIISNEVQSNSADLSIWNINGQLMHQSIVNDKANIDTSNFPPGLYFFQVTTDQGSQTIKWVKK